MSAFHNNLLLGSAKTADLGDPIEQSLRFTGDSVLYRDFSNTATSTDTGTFSFWVKRSQLTAEQTIVSRVDSNTYIWYAAFPGAVDKFAVRRNGVGWDYLPDTQFRDPSAWYHFVVSINNNTATVYINGTAHATTLTTDPIFTTGTDSILIGSESTTAASSNLNGYLAEFIFVDGQALTPSSFGKTNADGVWVPQNYTGSYGNRGFYLTFDPSGKAGQSGAGLDVGADHSPNNNHFTAYNFDTTSTTSIDYDVMPDTPTTNGITYLSAAPNDGYDGPYSANSTFDMTNTVLGSFPCTGGVDFDKNTGTYQIEYKVHSYYSNGPYVGACPADEFFTTTNLNVVGTTAAPLGFSYHIDGQKYQNGTNNAFGATFTTNDVIGLVFDTSSGEITAYKNGSSQGVIQNNCTGVWIPIGGAYGNAGGYMNFSSFVHPVSGTKPISTDSLGTQSIPDPSDHFRAITDTGANILTAAQAAFSTGLWWIKDRDNSNQHQLVNSVHSHVMNSPSQSTITYSPSNNASADGCIAWCWNYDSSDPSKNGFEIIEYTGVNPSGSGTFNVPHNLGKPVDFFICQKKVASNPIWVWHSSGGTTNGQLQLTNNNASTAISQYWGVPTSTHIPVGTSGWLNEDGSDYLMYAWISVPGYSKFGSYTGNSGLDNVFLYTGFKPAFVLIKSTASAADWQIYDTTRSPNNPCEDFLSPNNQLAETTGFDIDILSNGFKLRSNNGPNATTSDCIYAAFAENPFGGTNTAPATAR